MFCNRCGKDIGPDAGFCQFCGARQAAVPPPPGGQAGAYAGYAGPVKILRRSRKDKKIAGVCAGVADYLDLDPTIVRLVWLACFLLGGFGLIAYVVGWIAMPLE